jgi:hypothetical protein
MSKKKLKPVASKRTKFGADVVSVNRMCLNECVRGCDPGTAINYNVLN